MYIIINEKKEMYISVLINNIIMEEDIKTAIDILKKGGIILYPTDTIWGIGCDATSQEAVDKIYKLKKRENKKTMIVLVQDIANVARYTGNVPSIAWELMEMSDKPLTMILPNATGVAKNLIPEECTLGIRVPNNQFCTELLKRFKRPIVSTSVNITGETPSIRFADILQEMKPLVDYVVDQKFE